MNKKKKVIQEGNNLANNNVADDSNDGLIPIDEDSLLQKFNDAINKNNESKFIESALLLYELSKGDESTFRSFYGLVEDLIKRNKTKYLDKLIYCKKCYVDMEVFANVVERKFEMLNQRIGVHTKGTTNLKEEIIEVIDLAYWIYYGYRFNPFLENRNCMSHKIMHQLADQLYHIPFKLVDIQVKHRPHEKYTAEMFEHAFSLINNEKKNITIATEETLLEYGYPIDKIESFQRQFRKHRSKKIIPSLNRN